MSKSTVAAKIQTTSSSAVLMLAFELGEESWQLGFSTGLGQKVLRRKIAARCTKALLAEIAWARRKLGLGEEVRVMSCYEAGLGDHPQCGHTWTPRIRP